MNTRGFASRAVNARQQRSECRALDERLPQAAAEALLLQNAASTYTRPFSYMNEVNKLVNKLDVGIVGGLGRGHHDENHFVKIMI